MAGAIAPAPASSRRAKDDAMRFPFRLWPLALAAGAALGGCAVVPAERYEVREHRDFYYGYGDETVIITSTPRVEYRGYPPAVGYVWIDGYWNRVGARQVWVPGYWRPPHAHPRPIVRERDHGRDDDRRSHWREERRSDDRDRARERDRSPSGSRDSFSRDRDRDADGTRQRSEVRTPALLGASRNRGDGPVTAGERREPRGEKRDDRRDSPRLIRDRDRDDDRRDARPDWRTHMQSIRAD